MKPGCSCVFFRVTNLLSTANDEEHLVDEVHGEICGFPSGSPIRSGSGIDDEDEFATKFIYNNGNNASTDNITAGVAA